MNVSILTEGGKGLGFGHISRCSAIFKAFERDGIIPELYVNGDEAAEQFVRPLGCRLINWIREFDAVKSDLLNDDIVIIDSYLCPFEIYKEAAELVTCPVFLDDNNRIDYPEGCIVNGAVHADKISYETVNKNNLLTGPAYALLREPFWETARKKINAEARNVLITFGGNDSKGVTVKVLELLNGKFPALKKNVVIGKGFTRVKELGSVRMDNVSLLDAPDALKMKEIMTQADFVVSSAGLTLYELACTGVPAVGIAVSENQIANALGFNGEGFLVYAGEVNDEKVWDNLLNGVEVLGPPEERAERSAAGSGLIDGQGALRTVKRLKEMVKGEFVKG